MERRGRDVLSTPSVSPGHPGVHSAHALDMRHTAPIPDWHQGTTGRHTSQLQMHTDSLMDIQES